MRRDKLAIYELDKLQRIHTDLKRIGYNLRHELDRLQKTCSDLKHIGYNLQYENIDTWPLQGITNSLFSYIKKIQENENFRKKCEEETK